MTINEIVALAAVLLSVGTNVALYEHLSSVMNSRFDGVERKFENVARNFESMERRLEMIIGNTHEIDMRVARLESKP